MTREIPPFKSNLGKRLVKSSKMYIRDSGILHSLLNISDFNDLISHPIFGFSWEGFVIDNICSFIPDYDTAFYKTTQGAELDLILFKGEKKIAIECKVSDNPKLTKGFWLALEDVQPEITYIVTPMADKYPISENVWGVGIKSLFGDIEKYNR
jgi:predicted AAA+ superfamily ATPase